MENVEILRIEHPSGPGSSEDLVGDRPSVSDVGNRAQNYDSGSFSEDPCPDSIDSIEKKAGHFLLSIKERHRLTQTAVSFAVSSVKKLIGDACDDFLSKILRSKELTPTV